MRARLFAATVGCAALTMLGTATPASAATIGVGDPATLISTFQSAHNGDVVQLNADFSVGPADGHLAVPTGTEVSLDLNNHELEITAGANLAGIEVGESSALVITDTTGQGTLISQGGSYGAGIGGSDEQASGTISIDGGSIEATGGTYAAGIGGGHWEAGGTTVINDGTVIATGGEGGAGIGGGSHHGPGTVTINGGTVTAQAFNSNSNSFSGAAGIGGAGNGGSGTITINDGTVVATAAGISAGIGGGGPSSGSNGGVITITGGEVTASGGNWGGAGIGAAAGRSAGPVIIEGGTVTATGGGDPEHPSEGGPGIGQSRTGAMTISISGGTVTATGGNGSDGGGSGIGGGTYADGTETTIIGGTVIAHGTAGGAGIGGGGGQSDTLPSSGAAVSVGSSAVVTVSAEDGGSAIGQGSVGGTFGSLNNDGTLTVASGSILTIPTETTMDNSGVLIVDGAVVNNGTIQNTGTVMRPENVSAHHYLLHFSPNGAGASAPADLRVFAATLDQAGIEVPDDAEREGYTFDGWYAEPLTEINTSAAGDVLTGSTVLGEGADGPLEQIWSAAWTQIEPPTWPSTDQTSALTVGAEAAMTFSATGADTVAQTGGTLPEGLIAQVDASGVSIFGTPANGTVGDHTVEFTATNGGGQAVLTIHFTIETALTDNPPSTDIPAAGPPTDASGTGLPVTGPTPLLPFGIAASLLVAGLATMRLARRRRSQ